MTGSDPTDGEVFDLHRIRQLVELMEQHDLAEVDLRHEHQRIRLRRRLPPEPALTYTAPPMSAAHAPASNAAVAPAASVDDERNIVTIKSPMVGTFYGRPNPEAAPFVKVGTRVHADMTICIIEAMKVFNEIPAEISGTVVAILVEEEEGVEFGKPLFKVDISK